MPQKHGPGCRCCGCPIQHGSNATWGVSTSTISDFTEVAGDWTINGSGVVQQTAADAILIADTAADTGQGMYVALACTDPGSNGSQVRAIVGYLDSSNYLYAQIERNATSTLKLYQVVAGVHTQLGSTRNLTGMTSIIALYACFSNGTLTGSVEYDGGASDVQAERAAATAPGLKAGFATGAVPSGTASLTTFEFERHHSDAEPNCPACFNLCTSCIDSRGPSNWKVVISGVAQPGTGAGWGTGVPPAECSGANGPNGTYIVPTSYTGCGSFVSSIFTDCATPNSLQVTLASGDEEIWINIGVFGNSGLFKVPLSFPFDCMNLEDVVVPFDSFTPSASAEYAEADFSGATVTISAA